MSLNLENHTQADGYVHIYTDGSYFEKKQKIGIGFAIKSARPDIKPIVVSKSYDASKRAVLKALSTIQIQEISLSNTIFKPLFSWLAYSFLQEHVKILRRNIARLGRALLQSAKAGYISQYDQSATESLF